MNERYAKKLRRARSGIALLFLLICAYLDPRLDLDAKDRAAMAYLDRRQELEWKRVQRRNGRGV